MRGISVRGMGIGAAAALAAGAMVVGAGTANASTVRNPFGPRGYEGVNLGMTVKQAAATHKLTKIRYVGSPAGGGGCYQAQFKDDSRDRNQPMADAVIISKKYGVVLLAPAMNAKTPKGIGIGSTKAQVEKAYPNLKYFGDPYPYKIMLPNGSFYRLAFKNGRVDYIQLQGPRQNCFE